MNTRKYKLYLKEVLAVYGIGATEAEAIFKTAIARSYGAMGSAYIFNDGTVSVAMDDRGQKVYLKHYIISAKQYYKIVKIFTKMLDSYVQKRETLFFAHSVRGRIIDVRVLEVLDEYIVVKPILELGDVNGYRFLLPKKKMFLNDKFEVNEIIKVACLGFCNSKKEVTVSRFNMRIVLNVFEKVFIEKVSIFGKDYSYKNVGIFLDQKSKRVNLVVTWSKKPSSFVIGFLNKELIKHFGRCSLLCKEVNKKEKVSEAIEQ